MEYGYVNGDEILYHQFEPESKLQSNEWKCATSPPPKKSKAVHTSSGKVMMSFFFDPRTHCLSSSWNGEPTSIPSVIKPLYRALDEPSSRNIQACRRMALFSCMKMPNPSRTML
ncbi:uncharacterized protein TNCT_299401 [Trichonephila clavata]|uniref:Uncharacterized protein n=1 Tax=Trichonephila clavata TaxID=2740835 RepID=A0A8X6LW07_TRICU|nr:uncharacterized protein TNCT_299401 [Trichonephila clavata]